jgi:hypothetical protein
VTFNPISAPLAVHLPPLAAASKPLAKAVAAVSALPPDQHNLIALEISERVRLFAQPPTSPTRHERAGLEAELVAARRGKFASDAAVAATYAKYGL